MCKLCDCNGHQFYVNNEGRHFNFNFRYHGKFLIRTERCITLKAGSDNLCYLLVTLF